MLSSFAHCEESSWTCQQDHQPQHNCNNKTPCNNHYKQPQHEEWLAPTTHEENAAAALTALQDTE
jgi:hypothetical protein